MELIILASGSSSRFLKSGYHRSKYLLPFLGSPVIDHLKTMAGASNVHIVYNSLDMSSLDLRLAYSALFSKPPVSITTIEGHKHGPVHSLQALADEIDMDSPYAVTYCDYVASSFSDAKALQFEGEYDAAVLTYTGFHPHHNFPSSIYGYLKLNHEGIVVDYLEKQSFTDDRQAEACSAGLYIFRTGALMKEALNHVICNRESYEVNGELYISMLIKSMVERSLKVVTRETDYFAQLGTPEDYNDHVVWASCARTLLGSDKPFYSSCRHSGTCLILVSGEGLRFSREGYAEHKALLMVEQRPVLQHIIEGLPAFPRYVFSVPRSRTDVRSSIEELITKMAINGKIVLIDTPNGGQADSALKSLDYLQYLDEAERQEPVYIAPCDSILRFSDPLLSVLDHSGFGLVLAKDNPFARLNPESYSYALIRSAESHHVPTVSHVSVKERPESGNPLFVTGAFYAHSLSELQASLGKAYESLPTVNSERYLDSFISDACTKGSLVTAEVVDHYHSLGTPIEYRTSLYWNNFLKTLTA